MSGKSAHPNTHPDRYLFYSVLLNLSRNRLPGHEPFSLTMPHPTKKQPPVCRPGGRPGIRLRPYLSARETREPDFETTHLTAHPLSFFVACPTGDSLHAPRCLPRRTARRDAGSARTLRASGSRPPDARKSKVRCQPAPCGQSFRHGTSEPEGSPALDRLAPCFALRLRAWPVTVETGIISSNSAAWLKLFKWRGTSVKLASP